jgi:hypothetical protein
MTPSSTERIVVGTIVLVLAIVAIGLVIYFEPPILTPRRITDGGSLYPGCCGTQR